jgi:dihydrofolate synthase/folylpolyglutamate synthase
MNDAQMLEFLGSRLNYERRGMPDSQELRLDRVAHLLSLLGNPERHYKVVHVAGTKGKGSTATMTAAMLQAQGLKVGLHTSPHFSRLEERCVVDGRQAPPGRLAGQLSQWVHLVEEIDRRLEPQQPPLTFFEITTALILQYFATEKVDFAVVEVGMGGRLDSTNVVSPEVAVITSISLDHTRQLGDTIEQIAREKAGIIKPGRPVVSGTTDPIAQQVIAQTARAEGAPLEQLGKDISYEYETLGLNGGRLRVRTRNRRWPELALALPGEHQGANAALACAVMDLLEEAGTTIHVDRAAQALERLRIPGRVEVVHRRPTVILDVAHNVASLEALVRTLAPTRAEYRRRVLVFGASRDKDWKGMLREVVGRFDHLVLTTFKSNPRALPVDELAQTMAGATASFSTAGDPKAAWRQAVDWLGAADPDADDLICVAGSFYLAAEFREFLVDATIAP